MPFNHFHIILPHEFVGQQIIKATLTPLWINAQNILIQLYLYDFVHPMAFKLFIAWLKHIFYINGVASMLHRKLSWPLYSDGLEISKVEEMVEKKTRGYFQWTIEVNRWNRRRIAFLIFQSTSSSSNSDKNEPKKSRTAWVEFRTFDNLWWIQYPHLNRLHLIWLFLIH